MRTPRQARWAGLELSERAPTSPHRQPVSRTLCVTVPCFEIVLCVSDRCIRPSKSPELISSALPPRPCAVLLGGERAPSCSCLHHYIVSRLAVQHAHDVELAALAPETTGSGDRNSMEIQPAEPDDQSQETALLLSDDTNAGVSNAGPQTGGDRQADRSSGRARALVTTIDGERVPPETARSLCRKSAAPSSQNPALHDADGR